MFKPSKINWLCLLALAAMGLINLRSRCNTNFKPFLFINRICLFKMHSLHILLTISTKENSLTFCFIFIEAAVKLYDLYDL